ncbi:ATP-binding protein [Arthrobacter roseus]|uniref:ATP-binding protein n=1 Tax=Arthrobacter roseus TaxID=136274 RepID=UPI001962B70F|nr:signal transduction histidine kinase [Arthrobacter roseus]
MHIFFSIAVIAAGLVGRATDSSEADLGLVWPASGINFLWLVWAWRLKSRRYTALAGIGVVVAILNAATGVPPETAVLFGLGNMLQAWVAYAAFGKLLPGRTQRATGDFFLLSVASLVGVLVSAFLVAGCSLAFGDPLSPELYMQWILSNFVSMSAIGSLGLIAVHMSAEDFRHAAPTDVWEPMALAIFTAIIYAIGFGQTIYLPIAFLALPAAIWAGLRFTPLWAMGHALICGGLQIVMTLNARGPFGSIDSTSAAYIAQLFLFISFAVTAVLTLNRTEQRRTMAELTDAHLRAETASHLRDIVIAKLSAGVIVCDAGGRVIMQNKAFSRWMGKEIHLARDIASSVRLLTSDGEDYPKSQMPIRRAMHGEVVSRAEISAVRLDGTVEHFYVDAEPLMLQGGPGAVVIYHDYTDQRRHQQDLSRFASVVAHDLTNPLAVFDGWLEILEDPQLSAGERKRSIKRLRGASVRMRTLIRSLLTYSLAKEDKVVAAKIQVDDVAANIIGLHEGLAQSRYSGTDFTVDADTQIIAGPELFQQLMENLIGNAAKYAHPDRPSEVMITAEPAEKEGWTRITVRDNGIGIPESELDTVFTEFHRSPNGVSLATGSGLGLAICRRIVESHGGTIKVADRTEGGCDFSLTMPSNPDMLPAHVRFPLEEARTAQR